MPRGGARPNSGRGKGSSDLKTVQAFRGLVKDGIQPLQVMVWNMRKAYAKALEAEKRAVEAMFTGTKEEALEAVTEEWAYRKEAHTFAVAAAPYMHSKLATIELTGEGGGPIQTQEVSRPKLSKEEWLAAHGVGNGVAVVTDVTEKVKK